ARAVTARGVRTRREAPTVHAHLTTGAVTVLGANRVARNSVVTRLNADAIGADAVIQLTAPSTHRSLLARSSLQANTDVAFLVQCRTVAVGGTLSAVTVNAWSIAAGGCTNALSG